MVGYQPTELVGGVQKSLSLAYNSIGHLSSLSQLVMGCHSAGHLPTEVTGMQQYFYCLLYQALSMACCFAQSVHTYRLG